MGKVLQFEKEKKQFEYVGARTFLKEDAGVRFTVTDNGDTVWSAEDLIAYFYDDENEAAKLIESLYEEALSLHIHTIIPVKTQDHAKETTFQGVSDRELWLFLYNLPCPRAKSFLYALFLDDAAEKCMEGQNKSGRICRKTKGKFYRSTRKFLGIYQEEAAEHLGISTKSLERFEKGQSVRGVKLLERAYGAFLDKVEASMAGS